MLLSGGGVFILRHGSVSTALEDWKGELEGERKVGQGSRMYCRSISFEGEAEGRDWADVDGS